MININEHVVEIDDVKYIPYTIALQAINNVYIDGVDKKVKDVDTEMNRLLEKLNKLKFDD
tara:strand:+ start:233 stop:412 length:180 start_codon:yes stop_codon:yes gene_type:complete